MFLNNKTTKNEIINIPRVKKYFNHFFLFVCALHTLNLVEASEPSDEIKQSGPITRKRSSEDANALAQVNTNSNTFKTPNLIVKNEQKKHKGELLLNEKVNAEPHSFKYTQYQPKQYAANMNSNQVIYVQPYSPQQTQPSPFMQNYGGYSLQQPTLATTMISPLEMSKTIEKLRSALFSKEINNMSLAKIDELFSTYNDEKSLQEEAQKIGIYLNQMTLDGNNLRKHKKELSHVCIQDAPFLKYMEFFPNIKSITLSNFNGITDHGLHYLKYYKNLTTVSIENCFKITDFSLANMLINSSITSIYIVNCKNISPNRNGLFTGEQLINLKNELIPVLVDQGLKKFIDSTLHNTYHLTIDDMHQKIPFCPLKEQNPTALDDNFRSIFSDQKYKKTIKYYSLELYFSDILNQQYDPRTLEQQAQLSQQKIENNTLLNITIIYPNISRINLQGSHITEEGLWHLVKLPNLRYLDTRNSGISTKLQNEYPNKKMILALFDNLKASTYTETNVSSYFTF